MTKGRLKKLKALMKEAEHLEEQIRDLPFETGAYVGDTAKDGRTGFQKVFVIQGYSTEKYDRLRRSFQTNLQKIQGEIAELEEWLSGVEDTEIRDILRLQYINGLTQEQIADELGYSRAAIAQKLKRFWDLENVTDLYK